MELPTRVTKEAMQAKIVKEDYVRKGVLTWCLLTTECGFVVSGDPSGCVDPANYDQELGDKIAYDNALDVMWKLEGYLLAHQRFDNRV